MREYIRPNSSQEQKQREVAKLDALLQALRNCHRSLSSMGGEEDAFLARQDVESAFQRVNTLKKYKAQQLENQPFLSPIVNVDFETKEWEE